MSQRPSSKDIRKRIGHPVIDADGHWLEFGPSINDCLKEVAGQGAVDAFRRRGGYVQKSLGMTPEERAQTRRAQEAFWGGYSGYFSDLDGFAWEVAWNPFFVIGEDGSLRLPE